MSAMCVGKSDVGLLGQRNKRLCWAEEAVRTTDEGGKQVVGWARLGCGLRLRVGGLVVELQESGRG